MTNDFLFRFIHSLDKGELKYCKEQMQKERIDTAQLRIDIFNFLLKSKIYEPKQLLTRLSINMETLSVLKTRMYEQLVGYLGALHRDRRAKHDPLRKLDEARVLIELGMLEDAVSVLNRGISQAVKSEHLFAEVSLRELLRETYKSLNRKKHRKSITQNEYQLQTAVDKLGRLVQYTQINDRMWDYDSSARLSKAIDVTKARKELISRPEMQNRNLADSLPAQLRYFYVWYLQHWHNGHRRKALACQKTLIELWESNPAYLERLPNFYLISLSNYVGKLIIAGKAKMCPPLLEKMEKVNTNGRRAEILRFESIEPLHQLYAMNTGQLHIAIQRERKILKGLTRFGKQLRTSTRLTLIYNLGVSHLIYGNFSEALKRFSQIRDYGILESRQDLQGLARLFRLVLICEDDTSGGFQHYLRNGRRFFSKSNRAYILENLIYDWLQTHHTIKTAGKRRNSFKTLVSELKPLVAKKTIGAEEFLLYARAKAERKNINKLFLKSLKKPAKA